MLGRYKHHNKIIDFGCFQVHISSQNHDMNTARWNSMHTADREEAIQCPCEGGIQNIEHVMSECGYMVTYLDEMIDTVSGAMQSEPEVAQRKWLTAPSVGERVAAITGTEMRGVSPDALDEVASSPKLLVVRAEKGLRTVNTIYLVSRGLWTAWRCGHLTTEDRR